MFELRRPQRLHRSMKMGQSDQPLGLALSEGLGGLVDKRGNDGGQSTN